MVAGREDSQKKPRFSKKNGTASLDPKCPLAFSESLKGFTTIYASINKNANLNEFITQNENEYISA